MPPPAHRLVVALDVPGRREALALAERLQGRVGMLKVGLELFCAEGPAFVKEVQAFAPVFLDEGFIKSDSEFAGRAVTAWQYLGFQLIIGAPLGQVTALEPHMDLLLTVTKSLKGYSFVRELSDAPQQGSS